MLGETWSYVCTIHLCISISTAKMCHSINHFICLFSSINLFYNTIQWSIHLRSVLYWKSRVFWTGRQAPTPSLFQRLLGLSLFLLMFLKSQNLFLSFLFSLFKSLEKDFLRFIFPPLESSYSDLNCACKKSTRRAMLILWTTNLSFWAW
jgi:hypothetical protein